MKLAKKGGDKGMTEDSPNPEKLLSILTGKKRNSRFKGIVMSCILDMLQKKYLRTTEYFPLEFLREVWAENGIKNHKCTDCS